MNPGAGSGWVDIAWGERRVRIEHAWIEGPDPRAPLMVFLHEGLGSLAMWKDWPQQLCQTLGVRGLVYSRPGYGRSTPRAADEQWAADFMHRQAHEVLPALLQALGVQEPPWLLGHSDGGSIALLYASRQPCAGVIVLAPHILVEQVSLDSIALARQAYESGQLRQKLARYHDDVDSAFWGWNRAWLDPAFRGWRIDDEIRAITCPVLAVQGLDDEYGTLEQVHGIARRLPQCRTVALPQCGHSPHRDAPQRLVAECQGFFSQHNGHFSH